MLLIISMELFWTIHDMQYRASGRFDAPQDKSLRMKFVTISPVKAIVSLSQLLPVRL
jgi:hypothetical protein